MQTNLRSLFKQAGIFTVSTVLAFLILFKLGVITELAYHVEKGRLIALRESMPSSGDLDPWNNRTRSVAALVAPAVVQIVTERRLSDIAPIVEDFLGIDSSIETRREDDDTDQPGESTNAMQYVRDGYGSGFIVDADAGLVVTNQHVIEGADIVHVYLADGRRVDAVVRGTDRKSDIAVLYISADNLIDLPIGSSESVEVGDDVLAVGNPFGLEGSFSRGIISAKSRSSIPVQGVEYRGFLQTDAVINPGNSGGPLINMRGEVIGINTAIATQSGSYDGVGFAIPSSRIKKLLPILQRGEDVVRGYLGVGIVSVEREPDRAEKLGWDRYIGVIVQRVIPASPAGHADLRADDIIARIDGKAIRSTDDLIERVGETAPGTTIELTVWRDGAELTIKANITSQPTGFTPRPTNRP
ncbi:MAG: PDZ domain-containing protein [Planctomycetes bacterium]|nr:PDZ domain-containing protein [Planctomycetota bacterium]